MTEGQRGANSAPATSHRLPRLQMCRGNGAGLMGRARARLQTQRLMEGTNTADGSREQSFTPVASAAALVLFTLTPRGSKFQFGYNLIGINRQIK